MAFSVQWVVVFVVAASLQRWPGRTFPTPESRASCSEVRRGVRPTAPTQASVTTPRSSAARPPRPARVPDNIRRRPARSGGDRSGSGWPSVALGLRCRRRRVPIRHGAREVSIIHDNSFALQWCSWPMRCHSANSSARGRASFTARVAKLARSAARPPLCPRRASSASICARRFEKKAISSGSTPSSSKARFSRRARSPNPVSSRAASSAWNNVPAAI